MNRCLLTPFLLFLLPWKSFAQPGKLPVAGPSFYFNKFQEFNDTNADSSLYYLRLLAGNPAYSETLQDVFHNVFAQTFLKKMEKDVKDSAETEAYKQRLRTGYTIIHRMMADTSQVLVATARPVYLWTRVMEQSGNTDELIRLTTEFRRTVLNGNVYLNRAGRYALLIYDVIHTKAPLRNISTQLIQEVCQKLKAGPIAFSKDSATRTQLRSRAWHRYLYAYTNYLLGKEALSKMNSREAGQYLRTAFAYSPDLTDNNNFSAFFYDLHFLMEEEKRGFEKDYLDYLKNVSPDKKKTLETLLAMALINPEYKTELRSYYVNHFSGREDFSSYWLKAVNTSGKTAPVISLKTTGGSAFSSVENKGKWILLDFWGTWCVPCRAEHPELDSFYTSVKPVTAGKFELITIACRDTEDKVTAYMNQFHYSFPVAMADQQIESAFNVQGYPTKILITPQGRYVLVPFGSDWVDFVKKYADL